MKLEDIHIGDVVRIRQYEDMVREFGERRGGNTRWINIPCPFVDTMKYLCGQTFTVSETYSFGRIVLDGDVGWMITADMVEPAEQIESTTDEPYEYIDISAFLER